MRRTVLTDAQRNILRHIQTLAQQDQLAEAARVAEQALRDGLAHPFSLNVLAMHREQDGRIVEARGFLEKALELDPDDLGTLVSLGFNLLRGGLPREAQAPFVRALELDGSITPAVVGLGQALAASGRLREAEARFRSALDQQPQNPVAESGLASILGRRGEHAEAKRLAERVLAVEPNFPDAAMTLAASEIAVGNAADAASVMLDLLDDERAQPLERSLARSVLGDALDAQGQFNDAFAAYAASNTERERLYADRFGGTNGTLAYARALLAALESPSTTAIFQIEQGRHDSPVREHAFLLGFPRSGTTLIEHALASHPDVETLEERETLIDSMREFMRAPSDLHRLSGASKETLDRFRNAYWERVAEEGAHFHGKVFVDKHPLNALKLPLIVKLFPHAKILVARRDPRDVIWSCFRRRFTMSAPYFEMLSLDRAAALYDITMRIAAWPAVRNAHAFRMEDVIADFDGETRRLCEVLGISWTTELRQFATTAASKGAATASGAQLAAGLNSSGVGAWRPYRKHFAPILANLAPWVQAFGYERD